jgi:hypothetical protein
VSCKWDESNPDNIFKLGYNELFNGGDAQDENGEWIPWVAAKYYNNEKKLKDVLLGHCRESQADMVFMFMVAVVCIGTALMLFLKKRKGY